jgi:glucan 1,3-beta-glucosidase
MKNAENFYKKGFCALVDYGFNAFYFEAFDESWKGKSVGDNGEAKDETKWGAMTENREKKFDLKC